MSARSEWGLTLTERLQQKCSGWGVYWRASDAHGVILTVDQALELLRDALGVEVEIKAATEDHGLLDAARLAFAAIPRGRFPIPADIAAQEAFDALSAAIAEAEAEGNS